MKKRNYTRKPQGRPPKDSQILPKLKKLGVFRIVDAQRLGVSQPTLSRWVAQGKLSRLERGLYMHPNAPRYSENLDYIIACAKFGPDSAIAGMTALFYHGLIEQVPQRIWLVVPENVQTKEAFYRCIRTQTDPKIGIEKHGDYRITNLERTIVEAFRYSSKIGLRIALRATRLALANKRTNLQKIYKQAKALKLEKFLEKYWEAIVPESDVT